MTTFDYNYQNSFRFCFVIEICQSRWGLKNNSPNLHKKTTNWRILVVVVKWCHRAIVLFIGCIPLYKIIKIVRALWLAESGVCMRVCKHGCGVKMFCFSRANNASTNLKKFSSSKLNKFTLFAHSFVDWNLENRYKEGVSIFFA